MKENVFDVLMYLFDNYMDDGPEFHPDQEALTAELAEAGFPRGEVTKAFQWLEGLSQWRDAQPTGAPERSKSLRHYAPQEVDRLSPAGRGFLLSLEQTQVLDAATREIVIERALALDVEDITLEQLKWVTLMVLFNRPGHEYAHAFLEDLVFEADAQPLH
jgi:Smg protein